MHFVFLRLLSLIWSRYAGDESSIYQNSANTMNCDLGSCDFQHDNVTLLVTILIEGPYCLPAKEDVSKQSANLALDISVLPCPRGSF